MTRALYRLGHEGGLLGISGISGDIPKLEKAAAEGHERARLALDKYVYDVQRYIGSLAVELDGADVIVFTGGIGERGTGIRKKICSKLGFMGVCLDDEKNNTIPSDGIISRDDSGVLVMVVPTNEEIVVARETALCLNREE
jgi:acetate kinase